MKNFLAIYTIGDDGEGGGNACNCLVIPIGANNLDDAMARWSAAAAEKHNTTEEEMAIGFEGEPCLSYMVDENLVAWEFGIDGEWNKADMATRQL